MSKISYKIDVARISGIDLMNLSEAQITNSARVSLNIGEEKLPEFMQTKVQQISTMEQPKVKDQYDDKII
jgi:hypothetical protein